MTVEAGLGIVDRGDGFGSAWAVEPATTTTRRATVSAARVSRRCSRRSCWRRTAPGRGRRLGRGRAADTAGRSRAARRDDRRGPARATRRAGRARRSRRGTDARLRAHHGATVVSAGLSIGAARRGARWAVGLTFTVRCDPRTFRSAPRRSSSTLPAALAVGRTTHLGALAAAVEAGAVVSVLRVERTGPPPTGRRSASSRAHLGGELSFPARRVSFYVAVVSEWIPRTYPMTLDPEGEVDRTPALWLSGEAGLRFSLH